MYVNETAVDLARLKFARKGIHVDPIFFSDIIGEYFTALKALGADAHNARDERNGVTTHGADDSNHGASDE